MLLLCSFIKQSSVRRFPFTVDYITTQGTSAIPTCEPPRGGLTAGSWIVIGMYIFLGSFLLLGSVLDYFLPDKGVDGEYRRKGSWHLFTDLSYHLAKWRKKLWVRLLLCFSVQHNIPRLVSQSSESSKFMDGIRTLSMFWVILGHTNSYMEQVPLFNPFGFYSQAWRASSNLML